MKQHLSQKTLISVAVSLILVILVFNTALLARSVDLFNLPGEVSNVEEARRGAITIKDYYERQAVEAGVGNNAAVLNILAELSFELDKARTSAELVSVHAQNGSKVNEVIVREQENKRRDTVLSIIKEDPQVKNYAEETIIGISKTETEGVVISDSEGILMERTQISLKQNEQMKGTWPLIEVRIINGKAELVTSRTLIDRLELAERESQNLQDKLDEIMTVSGYNEKTGAGIVVNLFDAEDGFSTVDIVHDRDVRDVVNELYAAGANGVSVGGQRLVANSSIRCAGPVILVNQQAISVNPIVIQAMGDPQTLTSSLDLIKSQLKEFGIRVEITTKQQVVLPAFKEKK